MDLVDKEHCEEVGRDRDRFFLHHGVLHLTTGHLWTLGERSLLHVATYSGQTSSPAKPFS